MDITIFGLRRLVLDTLRGNDSPRQLAFGIAFGMLLGLVPKDNLTSIALVTLILATRVNLLAAIASAFAFTWIGVAIDPFVHRLGLSLLSSEFVQPICASMLDMPIVPWTNFNNTIVAGSLFFGLCFFIPVYFVCEFFFREYAPQLHEKLASFWLYRALSGSSSPE